MKTSTQVAPRKGPGRPSSYTEEEIRRGLLTIAICGGNANRAAETLEQQGHPIPASTLYDWRSVRYPELYREIHETHGRDIEAAIVPELRELMAQAAIGAQLAVQKATEQLEADQVKDPAGAARNLATTSAVAMDKLYLATDRPTEIRHNLTADELLDRLEARTPKAIDSTAVEEPEEPSEQSEQQTGPNEARFLERAGT